MLVIFTDGETTVGPDPAPIAAALRDDEKKLKEFKDKAFENLSVDGGGHLTYLAPTRVNLSLMEERWPDIRFRATREHH